MTTAVAVVGDFRVEGNKLIGGSVSCVASSGNQEVSDNAVILGSVGLSGASATSGICTVKNNNHIVGTTTITQGRNARVVGNNTKRRVEIKDVQAFEVVGNTAKTDAGEPIIWINPLTAANILAGVVSANNLLIKTGTSGAGYVTIGAGVTGVTDVNNNKLTVNWS